MIHQSPCPHPAFAAIRHESPQKQKPREARLHRRQLWRRARRLKKVFRLLQSYGLLPPVALPFRAAPAFVALAFRPADGGLKVAG